jgi:hypothetical protein
MLKTLADHRRARSETDWLVIGLFIFFFLRVSAHIHFRFLVTKRKYEIGLPPANLLSTAAIQGGHYAAAPK